MSARAAPSAFPVGRFDFAVGGDAMAITRARAEGPAGVSRSRQGLPYRLPGCLVEPASCSSASWPTIRCGGHWPRGALTRPGVAQPPAGLSNGLFEDFNIFLQSLTLVGICVRMARKSLPPLSASEQAIMDLLWKHQPAGLNELLDRINAGREDAVTRATLQTQLTRLEAKGWLKRDSSSRAHVYEAAVAETKGRTGVLAELKKRLFGGSSVALVRCLVENGDMSQAELAELQKLVRGQVGSKGGES